MIIAYLAQNNLIPQPVTTDNLALLKDALWIDLVNLSREEENAVEKILHLELPTREEMLEIEISSRLYKENGALFMTANMLAEFDSDQPKYDAVTFVLTSAQLITIRYIEPLSFKLFAKNLGKLNFTGLNSTNLLVELLEATVDRLADILEIIGRRLDESSKLIFTPSPADTPNKLDYKALLVRIGLNGDFNAKAFESLVTFNRLIIFLGLSINSKIGPEEQTRLTTLSKDITSLTDHANFHSNKVNFLLDATLGMVSIEQNVIIKIFSVAAVIFLPPTLIASIYGMNFKFIPELSWHWGYFFAIGLMLLSAWLPYKYFKRRKWL